MVIPTVDFVQESDMTRMAPDGVTVHFTRKRLEPPFGPKELANLSSNLDECVKLLLPVKPNVIVFGDTSASFFGGPGHDQRMIQSMERVSGLKATVTSASVVAAMRTLGMKKICVLTPYQHEVNETLVNFFEGYGFKIMKMREPHLELHLDTDECPYTSMAPEKIYQCAKEAYVPEADGVFISCTTLRAVDAIEDLERDLEKPVVTSNQSTMWNALRMSGIKDKINGFGQLFRRF